ncbi:MAG: preprotein translocase subunit SecE [Rickettsiales bacterium]|nr:preprotein translocase subunit SecE [Rickettsiales bacterium]
MNIFKFLKEVKQEGSKVTWASKQETTSVTLMVFIMVAVSAVFFLLVDWLMFNGVQFLLKF